MVLVGCLDGIFFQGHPAPVEAEPASMTRSLEQEANDRTGVTWAEALRH